MGTGAPVITLGPEDVKRDTRIRLRAALIEYSLTQAWMARRNGGPEAAFQAAHNVLSVLPRQRLTEEYRVEILNILGLILTKMPSSARDREAVGELAAAFEVGIRTYADELCDPVIPVLRGRFAAGDFPRFAEEVLSYLLGPGSD